MKYNNSSIDEKSIEIGTTIIGDWLLIQKPLDSNQHNTLKLMIYLKMWNWPKEKILQDGAWMVIMI